MYHWELFYSINSFHFHVDAVHISFLVVSFQQWMNSFILFNIPKQQILMNIKLAFPWRLIVWFLHIDTCLEHCSELTHTYLKQFSIHSLSIDCFCNLESMLRREKRAEKIRKHWWRRKSFVSISWREIVEFLWLQSTYLTASCGN